MLYLSASQPSLRWLPQPWLCLWVTGTSSPVVCCKHVSNQGPQAAALGDQNRASSFAPALNYVFRKTSNDRCRLLWGGRQNVVRQQLCCHRLRPATCWGHGSGRRQGEVCCFIFWHLQRKLHAVDTSTPAGKRPSLGHMHKERKIYLPGTSPYPQKMGECLTSLKW